MTRFDWLRLKNAQIQAACKNNPNIQHDTAEPFRMSAPAKCSVGQFLEK
jgi:hypothetical protein